MRPRDVPRPLLDLACARAYGVPPDPADDRDSIARALAAVLPEHEKQVRAKVAKEIEIACIDPEWPNDDVSENGQKAARIARGDR